MMAAERGMTVGAREARLMLNNVGVRPLSEKGVEERGWASKSLGEADAIREDSTGRPATGGCGLVERRPKPFSSVAARLRLSCSLSNSPVLVVLRFVPPPSGCRPTTVPYIDPLRLA